VQRGILKRRKHSSGKKRTNGFQESGGREKHCGKGGGRPISRKRKKGQHAALLEGKEGYLDEKERTDPYEGKFAFKKKKAKPYIRFGGGEEGGA